VRVVIAGGRDFLPTIQHWNLLGKMHRAYHFSEVVSGKAKGADSFGEDFARSVGLPITAFPADWEGRGKSAGYHRNKQMAEYCSHVILFKGGIGTQMMRDLAMKYRKPILYEEK